MGGNLVAMAYHSLDKIEVRTQEKFPKRALTGIKSGTPSAAHRRGPIQQAGGDPPSAKKTTLSRQDPTPAGGDPPLQVGPPQQAGHSQAGRDPLWQWATLLLNLLGGALREATQMHPYGGEAPSTSMSEWETAGQGHPGHCPWCQLWGLSCRPPVPGRPSGHLYLLPMSSTTTSCSLRSHLRVVWKPWQLPLLSLVASSQT